MVIVVPKCVLAHHEGVDGKPERADKQIDSKNRIRPEGNSVGNTLSFGTVTKTKNELEGQEAKVEPSENGIDPMSLK